MSVVDNTNKQMLYELLLDISKDNNIALTNTNIIKNFIDKQCAFFHSQRFEYGSLNQINKKIIELSYNYLLSLKNDTPKIVKTIEVKKPNFEEHQKNYNKLLNPDKPKEIDFTDGGKEFPIQNLDVIMNQTLADRQRELEKITNKYSNNKQAQKWLNREEEDTPKIKIEKDSNVQLDSIRNISKQNEKRVRFNLNNNSNNELSNLFSKLKKVKQFTNNDIMDNLKTIISNQEKILSILQSDKDKN